MTANTPDRTAVSPAGAEAPFYEETVVTGDWLPDSVQVVAYCLARRWNGFLVPMFPLESGLALAKEMKNLSYEELGDRFVIEEDGRLDYFPGTWITVGAVRTKVYGIGDSWCWIPGGTT